MGARADAGARREPEGRLGPPLALVEPLGARLPPCCQFGHLRIGEGGDREPAPHEGPPSGERYKQGPVALLSRPLGAP
eukprot:7158365-Alexandrium_andersonii.AAC.1